MRRLFTMVAIAWLALGFAPWIACSALTGIAAAADERDESDASTTKDQEAAAIEIPAADFRLVGKLPGRFSDEPRVIKSAEEFLAFIKKCEVLALTDDADLDAINRQINFEERELLIFAWSGSGRDELAISQTEADDSAFEFIFRRGLTKDLRGHLKLFAVKKGAEWKVAGGG